MKHLLLGIALVVASVPALAGVSMEMGAPGFYGRIEMGGFPPPPLIFPQPVIIEHHVHVGAPIYLHVPPGHAKHWSKHCHEYGACGQRVFFVQDGWYNDVYVPTYREKHGGGHGHGEEGHGGQSHGGGQGHGGEGHGQGHGQGHGKH